MKLKMSESKFGAPVGTYQAEFVGAEAREPLEGSGYGPGLEWQFRVVDGLHAGKIISRTTSQEPTTKNSCGRILVQLTGAAVGVGSEVDLAAYVGRRYTVLVEPNRTGQGTRVGTVLPAPAEAPRPALGDAPGRNRPPPPPPPVEPKAGPSMFWYQPRKGEAPELGTETEVQTWIDANGLDPAKVALCAEGEGEWKPAAAFGFTAKLPY
jgi:hypothetical protein